MRALVCTGLVVAGLTGCRESPATSITLVATNPNFGRATFTLECDPAGGDLRRPAAACARLARNPDALLHPKRFICFGGTSSWWDIRIQGRFAGEPVDVSMKTCWTRQTELIRVLGIAGEFDRHVDPLLRPTFPNGVPLSEAARMVVVGR